MFAVGGASTGDLKQLALLRSVKASHAYNIYLFAVAGKHSPLIQDPKLKPFGPQHVKETWKL